MVLGRVSWMPECVRLGSIAPETIEESQGRMSGLAPKRTAGESHRSGEIRVCKASYSRHSIY